MHTANTAETTPARTSRKVGIPPLARGPVFGVAAAAGLVLLIASAFGGYFFDELYFIAAGKYHPSASYADQPALLPMASALLDHLFSGSVVALRVPVVLVTVGEVLLAGLIAREFGGGRRAQTMAAAAMAISLHVVTYNQWFATYSLDPFWWMLICWLLVRWTRLQDRPRADWLLLAAGLATAAALQTKYLVPVLWLPIGVAALVVGPRRLLTRPLLWVGALIAVAATLPGLLWQAQHGWPQTLMTQVVNNEAGPAGGRLTLIPYGLASAGALVGIVLCCYGVWQLLRSAELRQWRYLGWAVLGVVAVLEITGGQPRYVGGLYALLLAAGAAVFERRLAGRDPEPGKWWRWMLAWPSYVVSGLVAVLIGLANVLLQLPSNQVWPQLAENTADRYQELPTAQREHTAVMTMMYPSAAAIDVFGEQRGLPPVYSYHRGYWYFGAPPESDDTVLFVGDEVDHLRPYFRNARQVGPADDDTWVLTGKTQPWSVIWPKVKTF